MTDLEEIVEPEGEDLHKPMSSDLTRHFGNAGPIGSGRCTCGMEGPPLCKCFETGDVGPDAS